MFLYFSPKIFVDDCITQGNATRKYIKESRRLVRFLTSMIYYFRGTKRCIEIFLVTRKNDCWNLCRIFDRVQRWDICVLTLRGTCWIAEQVPLHLPAWKHSIELPLSPSLYSSPSPLRPFFIFFFLFPRLRVRSSYTRRPLNVASMTDDNLYEREMGKEISHIVDGHVIRYRWHLYLIASYIYNW